MKELVHLLNEMRATGVVRSYALFGALAQMRYTEAVATLDADILVTLPEEARLDALTDVYAFCAARGWVPEGEAIRIGVWPTQFIPAFSTLTREALEHADSVDFEGELCQVVTADYLAVIALSVGRAKDFTRLLALLESGSVTRAGVASLAARHGLASAWDLFERRFLDGQ